MQTLRLIRNTLVFLGLCLDDEHRARQVLINGTITSLLIMFLCITMEFILTHMDNMADLMYAVMQFITFVTVTTCYGCFSLRKVETLFFFEKMQSIVDAFRKSFALCLSKNKCDEPIYSICKGYVKNAIDFTAMLSSRLIEWPNGHRSSILRLFTVS